MKIRVLLFFLTIFSLRAEQFTFDNASPIRQGVHVEWYRTLASGYEGEAIFVWSDTRYGMRNIFESSKIYSLVLAKSFGRHITMIFDDLSQNLGRQHFLLTVRVAEFVLLRELPLVLLLPSLLLILQFLRAQTKCMLLVYRLSRTFT